MPAGLLIVGGTPAHRGGVEQFCDRALAALVEAGGFRARHVFTHAAYLRPRGLPRLLGCVGRLVVLRCRSFDRVWLQYTSLPDLLVLLACWLLGYTVLVTPHLGANWASQSDPRLRVVTRRMLGLAHGIGLISPTQAEEVSLPAGPRRFELRTFLPRAFPPRCEAAGAPLRLVHAGRLSEGKGTFLFLDVCAALHRAGHPFTAELIGSCDDATRRRIDERLAAHGLSEVSVVARVPEPEMLRHLSRADVLVHPSVIDSFPLIVLESLGSGVYPICKDLPGARRMVETYCGRVVNHADAARDMTAFLIGADLDALRGLAAAARVRLIEDFSWPACVDAVQGAFAALDAR